MNQEHRQSVTSGRPSDASKETAMPDGETTRYPHGTTIADLGRGKQAVRTDGTNPPPPLENPAPPPCPPPAKDQD